MSKQNAMTLVTPVRPEHHARLTEVLNRIKNGVNDGTFKKFEEVGTIHYFRIVLLEDKLSTAKTNLVLSSDYDGDENTHIAAIAEVCGDVLDSMYECCVDYLAQAQRNPQSRAQYMRRWSAPVEAFYAGAPGRSLQQIKQESHLRDHIWRLLHHGHWQGKSAKEVHGIIRERILSEPEFQWAKEKISIPVLKWWNFALVIGLAILLFPLTLILAAVVGIWLLVIHYGHEKKDKPLGLTPSQIAPEHIAIMEKDEDFQNQNQFTQIIAMKPGWMRRVTIKAVLLYGKFRINNEFVHGELMGIPTIHFARWVMLDNNKQVLFFSNFDGSWQQYLGDFIDKSGWGLTAIFSNTENFPVTRYVFWGGAYDEEHFLAWSRYYQIPTAVWYCAYPHLSIKNVTTNSLIRSELIRDLNEEQAQTFLNRF
jgi:hypothetical protein